jgi:hypothetical protein
MIILSHFTFTKLWSILTAQLTYSPHNSVPLMKPDPKSSQFYSRSSASYLIPELIPTYADSSTTQPNLAKCADVDCAVFIQV